MNNILFEGIYSATFSIYDKQMNVIKPSVEKLIKYNLNKGIKGFYVGGNTGECTVLPNKTRKQMLETVKACAGNSQIIAHVGSGHLDDVDDLIDHANSIGVDCVASLPPSLTSYFTAEETVEYYKHLAKRSKAPVMAYITPILTCDTMWFARELMKIDNIIGVKLTIPNYYLFEQIKTINNGNINILNGPDESMLAGLVMGADGAIGTTYNIIPAVAVSIYDNFKNGNISAALEKQHKLNRLIDELVDGNLAFWKVPLMALGIDVGYTVEPTIMPSNEEITKILDMLEKGGYTEEMK